MTTESSRASAGQKAQFMARSNSKVQCGDPQIWIFPTICDVAVVGKTSGLNRLMPARRGFGVDIDCMACSRSS